jgi:hypothetical protein
VQCSISHASSFSHSYFPFSFFPFLQLPHHSSLPSTPNSVNDQPLDSPRSYVGHLAPVFDGTYTFAWNAGATAYDRVRVWIDNSLLIDQVRSLRVRRQEKPVEEKEREGSWWMGCGGGVGFVHPRFHQLSLG